MSCNLIRRVEMYILYNIFTEKSVGLAWVDIVVIFCVCVIAQFIVNGGFVDDLEAVNYHDCPGIDRVKRRSLVDFR